MSRLLSRLRWLRRNASGVALIEFAMYLPVLLIMGLMGVEVAHYAIAVLRVDRIAMTTADGAARVRDSISEVDVAEVFIGAKTIGSSIKFGEHGRVILSNLEPKTAGTPGQWIRWQRCYGMKSVTSSYGTPVSNQTSSSMTAMGPTGNQIAAGGGTAVMFVEIVYDYQPIVPIPFIGARTIRDVHAFNVRQRNDQVIKTGGMSNGDMMTCDKFTA